MTNDDTPYAGITVQVDIDWTSANVVLAALGKLEMDWTASEELIWADALDAFRTEVLLARNSIESTAKARADVASGRGTFRLVIGQGEALRHCTVCGTTFPESAGTACPDCSSKKTSPLRDGAA